MDTVIIKTEENRALIGDYFLELIDHFHVLLSLYSRDVHVGWMQTTARGYV